MGTRVVARKARVAALRPRVAALGTLRGLVALAVASCGAAAVPPALPAAATALPAHVGTVVAVDEVGDATIVLDEQRAFVVRGGAVVAAVAPPHGWRAGATVAALDGEGRWALGLDGAGRLWRITLSGHLEDVTDRFALGAVRGLAAAGTTTAFELRDGVAVSADGLHELRARVPAPSAIAASAGRIALLEPRDVEVWDLARGQVRRYAVPEARGVAFAGGRLAVAARDALYVESGADLHRIAAPAPITAVAAAGSRLWVLGAGLYALDGVTLRRAALPVPSGARLFASPSGDAWLAANGVVTRATLDRGEDDPTWRTEVAPVFARVCAHCHLPDGDAGIDLSTPATWRAERDELVRRVLVTRTMPPAGTDLSAPDRAALARWLRP